MKKKDWGNAVWLLFHTLAVKLKQEHQSELPILISHITQICNNLPCPDCQQHASRTMAQVKASQITSNAALIDFLWRFHNDVNKRSQGVFYPKEALDKYTTANTFNVIKHFIAIMSATSNNEKTMLHGFHRDLYIKQFIAYVNNNNNKYNP
jgi:hypothetical protein